MNFGEWLQKEKGFTQKAAHDAVSRLKRTQTILDTTEIPTDAVQQLESNAAFKELSICVKSQLKRTSKLYLEYIAISK